MIKQAQKLHWKTQYTLQESAVSTTLQSWLLHSGSFMQRLVERGVLNPRVHVLSQQWQCLEPWEKEVLDLEADQEALVREVLIVSDAKYWMFARSVFPRECLTGEEVALAHLQTRPLGSYLFNHPDMQRSEFAYTCLQPSMLWHQKAVRHIAAARENPTQFAELWSRYSLFHLREKKLLLTEVFLPDVAVL